MSDERGRDGRTDGGEGGGVRNALVWRVVQNRITRYRGRGRGRISRVVRSNNNNNNDNIRIIITYRCRRTKMIYVLKNTMRRDTVSRVQRRTRNNNTTDAACTRRERRATRRR